MRYPDVSPFPCSGELSPLEKTLMPRQPGEGASGEQVGGCGAVTRCVGVSVCRRGSVLCPQAAEEARRLALAPCGD